MLCLASVQPEAASAGGPRDLFIAVAPSRVLERDSGNPVGMLPARRSRLVTLDTRRLADLRTAIVQAQDSPRPALGAPALTLNLFDDAHFVAVVERVLPLASGYALRGRLVDVPGGRMTLALRGRTAMGTVLTRDAAYRIRAVGRDRYAISEVDRSLFPPDDPNEEWKPLLPPDDAPGDWPVEIRRPGRMIEPPSPALRPQQDGSADRPRLGNQWVPAGPAPILYGQVEQVVPDDEVAGAIHTVLAHPTDPDILYIGAVNGGIWRTGNATDDRPNWRPLTDSLGSLSIGAMAFDPNDPDTILAGIGAYSSFWRIRGGILDGLLITRDGGNSWAEIADPVFAHSNISGVSIRGDRLVVAAGPWRGGIFRSDDGGTTWRRAAIDSGDEGAMDLVEVPAEPDRFFASIRGRGIYRSDDGGATWQNVSDHDEALAAAIADEDNNNAEMAVAGNGRLYVAVLIAGQGAYIGFTDDQGETWSAMDLPLTEESDGEVEGLNPRYKPGGLGAIHFSIRVDPADADIVYVGGDRQDGPFPNFVGADDYTGRLFRGDANVAPTGDVPSPQWEHLTHSADVEEIPGGGTASGSAPHADSREMVFDARGDLIEVDDGGVYRRTSARDNTGDWFSLNGDLQVTEIHDIAYDPVSGIVISGNQDTGTSEQTRPDDAIWRTVALADGGDVAVDASESPGRSLRYSSNQRFIRFRRIAYDSANNVLSRTRPALEVDGVSVYELEPGFAFVERIALNAANPSRGVVGSQSVYETNDRFETLREVFYIDAESNGSVTAKASGCGGNGDLLYIGYRGHHADRVDGILVRTEVGDDDQPAETDFEPTGYVDDAPRDILVPADDCETVYAIDNDDVWVSNDTGNTWRNITGNLALDFYQGLRSIEFIPPGGLFATDATIAVAGGSGVHVMSVDDEGTWFEAGGDLPNAPVWDLDYDREDDVLVAGTLGRGAWRLRRGPGIVARIADRQAETTDGDLTVDVAGVFSDPSGEGLVYRAESSEPRMASVRVVNDTLIITPLAAGAVTITIIATDGNGNSATSTFTLTIGAALSLEGSVSAREGEVARLTVAISRAVDTTIELGYAIEDDGDAATPDADAADHDGGMGGTLTLRAGETSAVVEIPIHDDAEIEATREVFSVTLVAPELNAEFGLGLTKSSAVVIHEGVCDRTEQVRDALRGDDDCAAVADLGTVTFLSLSRRGIVGLKAKDFLGLQGLRFLILDANALAKLPDGLFDDLRGLELLNMSGNELTTLPAGVFDELHGLSWLYMSGNELAVLPQGVFDRMENLVGVWFNDNHLVRLAPDTFAANPTLAIIDLAANRLETLPPGLFDGLFGLEQLHLQDNPGAPFSFVLRLVRTDASALHEPSPAVVRLVVAQGAPFDISADLAVSGGLLSATSVTVPTGRTRSSSVTATQARDSLVTVGFVEAPPIPVGVCAGAGEAPCYDGVELALGEPLQLFKARPRAVASISTQSLTVDGDAVTFDLSTLFADLDSAALTYAAQSSDPQVATVSVEGRMLTVTPRAEEGESTVTVTATDEVGLTATLTFNVMVDARRTGIRGWRLWLLESANTQNETPESTPPVDDP